MRSIQTLQQTAHANNGFSEFSARARVWLLLSLCVRPFDREIAMRNEFTAVIEREDDWYIGYCPEIPGANGQGRTIEECRASLADAIALILEDRREEGLGGVPPPGCDP
jgi:predicted RNase H-like HicB family nuclease